MGKCGRPGAEAVTHEVHSPAVKDQVKDSPCISVYILVYILYVHTIR